MRHIVFSGGGAKGAYQAGFLASAFNRNIKFDVAHGISVGAINAAGVATGKIPQLLSKWKSIEEKDVMKKRSLAKFAARLLAGRLPFFRPETGLHDTEPLRDSLREFFKDAELFMPLFVGRVELRSGGYFDRIAGTDSIADAVYRSTLVPVMMRADVTDQQVFVDGGVHNVTPLSRVVEFGNPGDQVIVVTTERSNTPPKPINKKAGRIDAIDILKATIDYLVDMQFERDLQTFQDRNQIAQIVMNAGQTENIPYKYFDTYVVEPSESLGSGSDYSRQKLSFRYNLGIADGTRFFKDFGTHP